MERTEEVKKSLVAIQQAADIGREEVSGGRAFWAFTEAARLAANIEYLLFNEYEDEKGLLLSEADSS